MTEEEKKINKLKAIGEIHNAGFNIVHRHENTLEPMLMGGREYIARRGSYLLYYNVVDEYISLQKTDSDYFDFNKSFIFENKYFTEFTKNLAFTIALELGINYYDSL